MNTISFQLPWHFMRYISQDKMCANGRRLNTPWLITITLLASSELRSCKVIAGPCLALCFEYVPWWNKGEEQAKAVLQLLTKTERQSRSRKVVGEVMLHLCERTVLPHEVTTSPLPVLCISNSSLLCPSGPYSCQGEILQHKDSLPRHTGRADCIPSRSLLFFRLFTRWISPA